jgi:hypothetical protein
LSRVFLEGIVIVASILLAFTIDALWEDRQLRVEEQGVLHSLRTDFLASQSELLDVLQSLESNRAAFERLQATTPDALSRLPADSVSMAGLTGAPSFDAYSGTLNALVGAGKLDLIRDVSLREVLLDWMHGIDDLPENLTSVRAEAERLTHAMEPFGGPFFYGAADLSALPRVNAATLSAMRANEPVMGAARSFQLHLAFYRRDLESLAPLAESALALLDENIR